MQISLINPWIPSKAMGTHFENFSTPGVLWKVVRSLIRGRERLRGEPTQSSRQKGGLIYGTWLAIRTEPFIWYIDDRVSVSVGY